VRVRGWEISMVVGVECENGGMAVQELVPGEVRWRCSEAVQTGCMEGLNGVQVQCKCAWSGVEG